MWSILFFYKIDGSFGIIKVGCVFPMVVGKTHPTLSQCWISSWYQIDFLGWFQLGQERFLVSMKIRSPRIDHHFFIVILLMELQSILFQRKRQKVLEIDHFREILARKTVFIWIIFQGHHQPNHQWGKIYSRSTSAEFREISKLSFLSLNCHFWG